ncbi:MAG: hypothetical protein Q9164_007046 [Protoblastenia rupestris]
MGNSSSKQTKRGKTKPAQGPRMFAPRQYKPAKVLGANVANQYATQYYYEKTPAPRPSRLPPKEDRKYMSNTRPQHTPHPSLPKSEKRWRDPNLVVKVKTDPKVYDDYHYTLLNGYEGKMRGSMAYNEPGYPLPKKPVGEGPKNRRPKTPYPRESALPPPLFHVVASGHPPPKHASRYVTRPLPPRPPPAGGQFKPLSDIGKAHGMAGGKRQLTPSGVGGGIFRPRDSDNESYMYVDPARKWI